MKNNLTFFESVDWCGFQEGLGVGSCFELGGINKKRDACLSIPLAIRL